MRRRPVLASGALAALAALAGCSSREAPEPRPTSTDVPAALRTAAPRAASTAPAPGANDQPGTPMAEREAVLGLLNKRNNLSQDLTMKPGEQRRVGDVVIRLAACERTAPWEMPRETGAFVQVFVKKPGSAEDANWPQVFSGWLFRNSPSLNVVEHPIYDVWVKDCKMRFPGEEDGRALGEEAEEEDRPSPRPDRSPNASASEQAGGAERAAPSNAT